MMMVRPHGAELEGAANVHIGGPGADGVSVIPQLLRLFTVKYLKMAW
jgi:hypothetical protein